MGCFAHTLNLIVQSALELESDIIDKVKAIVTYFRKSIVANNKLKTYQINNSINTAKILIQDVQIRGTMGLLDKAPENVKSEEWIILKELYTILKPFEEATRAVSGESYMTASIVIVLAQGLINVFNKFTKMDFNIRVHNIINKLISNMEDQDVWKNIDKSKILCRCTFLDPRFKHNYNQ